MKNFLFLLFSMFLFFTGSVLIAQTDTTLTVDTVADQITAAVQIISGKDLTFKIMLVTAIVGALAHIIWYTKKGIEGSPSSPYKFVLWYWIKDNILSKLFAVCSYVLGSQFVVSQLAKLPAGWISYLSIGLIGLLIGFFIDFFASRLKKIIPKNESLTLNPAN